MERGLDEFMKFVGLCNSTLGRNTRLGESDHSTFFQENHYAIEENCRASKFNVLHFIIVDRNERVIELVKDELRKLDHRIGEFVDKNEGYKDKGLSLWDDDKKNWLPRMFGMVTEYTLWFAQLIHNQIKEHHGVKVDQSGKFIPVTTPKPIREPTPEEYYPKIFKMDGFMLFNHLMINCATKSIKTDVAYFYRKMETDYMKVGETEFRRWIETEYGIEISKIKTDLDTMDTHYKTREYNYSLGLEWLKSQPTLQNKIGTKLE